MRRPNQSPTEADNVPHACERHPSQQVGTEEMEYPCKGGRYPRPQAAGAPACDSINAKESSKCGDRKAHVLRYLGGGGRVRSPVIEKKRERKTSSQIYLRWC